MWRIIVASLIFWTVPFTSAAAAEAEDCAIVVSTDIDPDKRPRKYGDVIFSFRSNNSQSHYVDTDGDHEMDIMLVDEGVDWKMDRIVCFYACRVEKPEND